MAAKEGNVSSQKSGANRTRPFSYFFFWKGLRMIDDETDRYQEQITTPPSIFLGQALLLLADLNRKDDASRELGFLSPRRLFSPKPEKQQALLIGYSEPNQKL